VVFLDVSVKVVSLGGHYWCFWVVFGGGVTRLARRRHPRWLEGGEKTKTRANFFLTFGRRFGVATRGYQGATGGEGGGEGKTRKKPGGGHRRRRNKKIYSPRPACPTQAQRWGEKLTNFFWARPHIRQNPHAQNPTRGGVHRAERAFNKNPEVGKK